MKSGVYQIRNLVNNKCYIGSARNNFVKRWQNHQSELRLGKHHSIHLQRAWNKHNSGVFVFEVLLYCDPKDCLIYEQIALDHFKPAYNISKNAIAPMSGRQHSEATKRRMSQSRLGKTLSKETRQKISKSNKGNQNCLGRRLTKKTKLLLSKQKRGKNNPNYEKFGATNPNAKLANGERMNIVILYQEGKTQRELARLFDVAQSTIYRIIKEYL